MTSTLTHPPKSMLEVWETLPEGTLCQLINNKLIMSPGPKDTHQVMLNKINIAVSKLLEKTGTGEVRISPYDVYFSKQNILQPDIIFIKSSNLYKIEDKGMVGAPDLVIEILSFSTSHLDYEEKKLVYEKFGVQEYFIVDPNSKSVDSFILKNGEYEEQEVITGTINSNLLGAEVSF